MPTSFYFNVPPVMYLVKQLAPRSFLDIGVGSGRYGFLFREYLAHLAGPTPTAGVVDGIEVFEPYLTSLHRDIYDHLHVGHAEEVIDRLGRYDLVFLGDVIEHLHKDSGGRLVDKAFEHAEKAVVVTTPARWIEQGPLGGNAAEAHRSLWSAGDFAKFPNRRQAVIHGLTRIVALAQPGVKLPPLTNGPRLRLIERLRTLLRRRR